MTPARILQRAHTNRILTQLTHPTPEIIMEPLAIPADDTNATVLPRVPGQVRQILVVDDEEPIRRVLTKWLESRGFEVQAAPDGRTAIELLERHKFQLIVCDLRMPGMTGQEVVTEALGIDPDLAIVMLSGINDAVTANQVLAMGANDYLVKPVELDNLHKAVERALQRRHLRIEQRKAERLIRDTVITRTVQLETEKMAMRDLTINVVETLINAMEAKDIYLRGHSQRVADLSASIAQELGLDEDTIEQIRLAGRLHDIGKIGVREAVLNKPGALSVEEYHHVMEHVRIGVEILAPLHHLGKVVDYVHEHHEQVDGRGYPRSLQGDRISIGGRILAVADAFDALTSRRSFRDPLTPRETLETMSAQEGTRFDSRVMAALRRIKGRRTSVVFLEEHVDVDPKTSSSEGASPDPTFVR